MGGKKYRIRSIDSIIEELEKVKQKYIIFVDPSLSINVPYMKNLFRRMVSLNKKFACFMNINAAHDDEFLNLASEAGCIALSIGFETFSESAMKGLIKLPKKTEDYKRAVKKIHEHGIAVLGSFVFGFDDDKKDVFENSLNLMKYIDVDSVGVNILTPFPGTPLFDRLEREERIFTRDWSRYNMRDVVFFPKHMSPEELKEGASHVAKEFFSWKNIINKLVNATRYGILRSLPITYWNLAQRRAFKNIWKWS